MREILRGLAAEATPTHFDLWDRISATVERDSSRRKRSMLLGFGTMTVGTLVVVALLLAIRPPLVQNGGLLSSSPTVSSPTDATSTPETDHLSSYRLTVMGRARNDQMLGMPFSIDYREWQSAIWFQAPDLIRIETYDSCAQKIAEPPTPAPDRGTQGGRAMFYGPTFDRCPTPSLIGIQVRGGGKFDVKTPNHVIILDYRNFSDSLGLKDTLGIALETLTPYLNPRQVHSMGNPPLSRGAKYETGIEGMIAGRKAISIKETFYYPVGTTPPQDQLGLVTNRTLWLDQQTGIPLAAESVDDKGVVLESWTVTSFEVNPAFDPGIFAFIPTGNAAFYVEGMDDLWKRFAQDAPFTFYIPTGDNAANIHMPSRLVPDRPTYDMNSHTLTQTYRSRADVTNPVVVLTITETEITAAATPALGSQETGDGRTIINGEQYQESGDKRVLTLITGSTLITLEGQGEVTKDDLYKVLNSFQALVVS